jgi:hypothetical protein
VRVLVEVDLHLDLLTLGPPFVYDEAASYLANDLYAVLATVDPSGYIVAPYCPTARLHEASPSRVGLMGHAHLPTAGGGRKSH